MPLWRIFHSDGFFTSEDQNLIAQAITKLYTHLLPAFYVNVIFVPLPAGSIYIGGTPRDNFVRLVGEHIARNFDGDSDRMNAFMKRMTAAVAPILQKKKADWEAHVAETPYDFWVINGIKPPPAGSEQETKWKNENKPSPY